MFTKGKHILYILPALLLFLSAVFFGMRSLAADSEAEYRLCAGAAEELEDIGPEEEESLPLAGAALCLGNDIQEWERPLGTGRQRDWYALNSWDEEKSDEPLPDEEEEEPAAEEVSEEEDTSALEPVPTVGEEEPEEKETVDKDDPSTWPEEDLTPPTPTPTEAPEEPVVDTGEPSEAALQVAGFAQAYIGFPYKAGGTNLEEGTDCSGFVMAVYEAFGVSLPHSSAADRSVGRAVEGGLAAAQPGDIICYSGHVGIYIGDGQIVHAFNSRVGVVTTPADYDTVLVVRRIF
ncbi:MAG: C40 family peptidase [Lachnospiraceae bacterium]|nr:C40 family peptidase [Lachnospiraceae bacterium]